MMTPRADAVLEAGAMVRGRVLAVLAVLGMALPAAAFLGPALREAATGRADPDNGPPLYGPTGDGLFPAEGQLGMANCAAPARVAQLLAGAFEEGAEVCLENTQVVGAATDRRRYDTTSAAFTVRAPDGAEVAARIPAATWWQHGTPAAGMVVVVEGTVALDEDGAVVVDPVARWVELGHPGPVVQAWEVSAGRLPELDYVWVGHTTVADVHRNGSDGDNHIETGTLCPAAHLTTETTPPYFGIVEAPPMGATVSIYGQVRYDDYHGWWELHPLRAWLPLDSAEALRGCPEGLGQSGVPPPGLPTCIPGPCPAGPR